MIDFLYCQDLTKSALSTVSEGEPSSTLFAVLCIDTLAFFIPKKNGAKTFYKKPCPGFSNFLIE